MPVKRKSKRVYKKKSFATKVKKVITKMSELKHKCAEVSVATVAAGTIYTQSPTQTVIQGVGNDERIGDSLYLHKIKIHGYVFAAALPNACVKFRISVLYSSIAINAATITAAGLSFSSLYLPGTTSVNGICGQYDEKAVTVLSDQTIDLNSMITNANDIKSWSTDIYLKDRKMDYLESGSPFGKTKNLYVMMQAYSAANTHLLNCGSFFFSYDLQYKDI